MSQAAVIDARAANLLLRAHAEGATEVDVSLDLGRSQATVPLTVDGVQAGDAVMPWESITSVAADEHGCFEITAAGHTRIQCMSQVSGRLASLYSTAGPPALLLSGTLMHRIKGVHPGQDTELKLAPLGRLQGCRVLDSATGLGYTAIEAARRGAESVTTVELDPAVVDLQQRNPWSRELQEATIQTMSGDISEVISTFDEAAFDRILHDPPVLELAGDLYGGAFYAELRRTLARRGRLFHYIGNLESPSGKRTTPGVVRRLEEAGFTDVRRRPEAFGVSARA